jgi:hypothetical protein
MQLESVVEERLAQVRTSRLRWPHACAFIATEGICTAFIPKSGAVPALG